MGQQRVFKPIRFGNNRHKRAVLPTLIITLTLLTTVTAFIFLVPPQTAYSIPVFIALTGIATLFFVALVAKSKTLAVFSTIFVSGFLTARLFGLGDVNTAILLLGILMLLGYAIGH